MDERRTTHEGDEIDSEWSAVVFQTRIWMDAGKVALNAREVARLCA